MPDHNRRATNFKTALPFDRAQATFLWIPWYCARSDAIVQSERGRSTRPRFSSFGECIRLASRYVTSLENQLVPNLLHPPFGLLSSPLASLHSLQQPCQPILANHRCNLTQPSRNRSNPPSPLSLFPSHLPSSHHVSLPAVGALAFFTRFSKHCL